MIDNSQFSELQKQLGPRGRLGVFARLFEAGGQLRNEVAFNADELFPMASIAKIAIAMLVASRVQSGACRLDEIIRIDPRLISPGLLRNPIDHLFFVPFKSASAATLDRLLMTCRSSAPMEVRNEQIAAAAAAIVDLARADHYP